MVLKRTFTLGVILGLAAIASRAVPFMAQGSSVGERQDGKRLFERETFGGNGRTCLTCHSRETGTVSPQDARARFLANPKDPLFLHDGSDDGLGHGVTRMLRDATILIEIPLPPNVSIKDSAARSVTLRRGIPTTLNTPALDPVLMLDGRAPDLQAQAADAIRSHAQATVAPDRLDLQRIAEFQLTDAFFSSNATRQMAHGGPDAVLPEGKTESEKRGRVFFDDVPFNPVNPKAGLCAGCHAGPLLNEVTKFAPPEFQVRFLSVGVSEFNFMGNPVRTFVFSSPNGAKTEVPSPDPGRALITGSLNDVGAFKIPVLRGIAKTAPYFHDNSAKSLEDVAAHYSLFFNLITGGFINITPQDQADIVAYMKLLN